MPLVRALTYAIFAFWVSVCAFVPEVIWQGIVLLRGHFGHAQLYSALFIGTLFAFFVEPLMERLKAGRWRPAHEDARGLLLATLVSIVFGAVVVCIHEAITAYLGEAHTGDQEVLDNLASVLDQAQEWAAIPWAVTVAWLVAGVSRRWALPTAGLACIWIVAVGVLFRWGWPVIVTTSVPGCVIALLGVRTVVRRWDADTFPALARLTAFVVGSWLVLAWLAEEGAQLLTGSGFRFYTPGAFSDDLLFYVGWSLGLAFAPNPVARN